MTWKKDTFTSAFLLLLSGFLWWAMGDVPPDVAYYPKALVFCLFACGLVLFARAVKARASRKGSDTASTGVGWQRASVELIVMSAAYILVLPYLGFITSSMIFLVFLMWRLGVRNWGALLGASVATVILIYVGFEKGLMVPLPDGYAVWSLFF